MGFLGGQFTALVADVEQLKGEKIISAHKSAPTLLSPRWISVQEGSLYGGNSQAIDLTTKFKVVQIANQ